MRVNPNYIANLAVALNSTQASEQNLTEQLSSGVRVNSLGEDPIAAGQNVILLNQIQQDDSFNQSANLVTGKLQVADSSLGSIVSQLTKAISLATSANNGTRSANDVLAIAQEITGIRDEVMTLANTSYQGQYIFAGTQTASAPFSTSNATNPATTSYTGDATATFLSLPNGQKIQLNVPGNQIFQGPGSKDVFAALNNLIADYSTGTVDQAQAAKDTAALTSSLNYVSQQRVMIDNSITSLSAASDAMTNEKTQLIVAQTNLMQADVAQLATRLSLAETQQTALQAVIVQLSAASNSLFSKL
jgi:flagellar hook-associated protein 3 FlgL